MKLALRKPRPGEDADATVLNARWVSTLVTNVMNAGQIPKAIQATPPIRTSLKLAVPKTSATDGGAETKVAIPHSSVIGVLPYAYTPDPSEEQQPCMQATIGRGLFDAIVLNGTVDANNFLQGFMPMPFVPIRLRIKAKPTDPEEYERKYIPGMPVGRLEGTDCISSGCGGFILLTEPYSEDPEDPEVERYAWVMPDSSRWDGYIVRPESGDADNGTNYLTDRGTYTFGLTRPTANVFVGHQKRDVLTDYRGTVAIRDHNIDLEDGTPISVEWRYGEWRHVDIGCYALPEFTNQELEP